MNNEQIDCVVRFHDPLRLDELNRCIFSLVGQKYRPLNIILVTQRFTDEELAATRASLAPMLSIPNAPSLQVCNWDQVEPKDGRTELLNLGLSSATGRYVAFLDYDDTLYPEAYELLVGRLRFVDAAVAFASVQVVRADLFPQFTYVAAHIVPPFGGKRLLDLFQSNFCPIHSYVFDRQKIGSATLRFDQNLTWEEDYDLLLRVCATYPSDFSLLGTVIGDYYYKNDGSNSVPTNGCVSPERLAEYEDVQKVIELRRRNTCLAPVVQQELGFSLIDSSMTIRSALDVLIQESGVDPRAVQCRRLNRVVGLCAYIYHLLPRRYRTVLKNFVFRTFRGFFSKSEQYKAWVKFSSGG